MDTKTTHTPRFRPFTAADWEGFAGATPLANGGQPLTATIAVDGHDGLLVLDAQGLWLMVVNAFGDTLFTGEFAGPAALHWVAQLKESYSHDELAAAGWQVDPT